MTAISNIYGERGGKKKGEKTKKSEIEGEKNDSFFFCLAVMERTVKF